MMKEVDFLPLKVIGLNAKGKRKFDPEGKRKLIEVCRRPGASVASLAQKAGVNANQLHNWMSLDEARQATAAIRSAMPTAPTAFVPVVEVTATASGHERVGPMTPLQPVRLAAQFPSGVTVELHCAAGDTGMVAAIIKVLGER